MPINGSGCLECCVEKDPEAATRTSGQGRDWLAMSVSGTGMKTGTTDTHSYYSFSKSSLLINALLLVSRTIPH